MQPLKKAIEEYVSLVMAKLCFYLVARPVFRKTCFRRSKYCLEFSKFEDAKNSRWPCHSCTIFACLIHSVRFSETEFAEALVISKRLNLPQDNRKDTNLITPLRMHFEGSEGTRDNLKSVFQCKGVKEHTSQRSKRPELIPASLA